LNLHQSFSGKRVYVAGHKGMVGSALVRALNGSGCELVTRTSRELDLRNQSDVNEFFSSQSLDVVIFAAAKVGGIHANYSYPAEFLYDNLMMATNAIHAAYQAKVPRFLFLGSTCIYPRLAPQPIPEGSLLTSELEKTNEAYALAKIAGLKLCQYYRQQYGVLFHSAMPTNLYGPGDNYHPENSHVLPALLRRIHESKQANSSEVKIWGSGTPQREFLHVDDLAQALLHLALLENPPDWVNVGSGEEVTILELAKLISQVVRFAGNITLDPTRPDGTPRKLCDTTLLRSTGWKHRISLAEGIASTYQDFLTQTNRN
jgi:GDP-L-fucose synthase